MQPQEYIEYFEDGAPLHYVRNLSLTQQLGKRGGFSKVSPCDTDVKFRGDKLLFVSLVVLLCTQLLSTLFLCQQQLHVPQHNPYEICS